MKFPWTKPAQAELSGEQESEELLAEEPTQVDQAAAQARLAFLNAQMTNFHAQLRAMQIALTLAAGNGELSSEFRQWAYNQLLQTAAVVEERR